MAGAKRAGGWPAAATAEVVYPRLQPLDVDAMNVAAREQLLDRGLEAVGELAQAHRAGQPRAALERVQRAHARRRATGVVGAVRPLAHLRRQLRQQVVRLLLEHRQQIGVDRVLDVEVVVIVEREGLDGRCGRCGRRDDVERKSLEVGRCRDADLRTPRLGNVDRKRLHRRLGVRRRGRRHGGGPGGGPVDRIGRGRDRGVHRHGFDDVDGESLDAAGQARRVPPRRLGDRHGCRLGALGAFAFVRGEPIEQQLGRGVQEAGGELVQQPADRVGRLLEQFRLVGRAGAERVRARQRVLERASEPRQVLVADGGRAAGERVRERDRRVADRAVQLVRPLGELGAQPPRQLVGLVQVDVEQRDADAQRPDRLVLLGLGRDVGLGGGRVGRDRLAQFEREVGQRLGRHRHQVGRDRVAGLAGRLRVGACLERRRRLEGREVELERDLGGRLGGHAGGLAGERRQLEHERLVDGLGDGLAGGLGRRRLGERGVERSSVDRRGADDVVEIGQRRRGLDGFDRPGRQFEGGSVERKLARQRQAGHGLGQRRRGGGRRLNLLAPSPQAQRVGGLAQRLRAVMVVATRGGGVGPGLEMVERVAREAEQVGVGARGVGQAGVVQLLARPRRVAEVGKADHARAPLERVKGAAHGGEACEVVRRALEHVDRLARGRDDLARLLDEDLAHLVVRHGRGRGRCGRRLRDGRNGSGDGLGHRLREVLARRLARRGVAGTLEGRTRAARELRERALVGHRRLVQQALERAQHLGVVDLRVRRRERERLRLLDERRRQRTGRRGAVLRLGVDARAQAPGRGVEDEQRLREHGLHAEHVDHEAERAEVRRQPVDDVVGERAAADQRLDVAAHAHRGERAVVEAEHRQHAAHRLQLAADRDHHVAVRRVAEVLVDRLLDLAERDAQLVHDAAHRLAVGHATVQVLHPAFERRRAALGAHHADALGQPLHARGLRRVVEVGVLERRVEVQQRRRDFHRELGRRRFAALDGGRDRRLQGGGERFAVLVQTPQRIADERHLLVERAEAHTFAAGHRRPRVFRRLDALARLRDPRRVEAAERRRLVVDGPAAGEAEGAPRRREPRRRRGVGRGAGLRAEEQQVASQALGDGRRLAGGRRALREAQLREQARREPLAVDVDRQQPLREALERRRREVPQRRLLGVATAVAESREQLAHARRRRPARLAQQREHLRLDLAAQLVVGRTRRGAGVGGQHGRRHGLGPQVGRVHAVGAGELLHRAVLREQPERGHRLAGESAGDEVEQRERRALDRLDRRQVEQRGLGDAALHRRLARLQQRRAGAQADQLERAGRLVQLVARLAQHRRVDGAEVGAVDRVRLAQVAPQRLVRGFERAAQLLVHPRQGAQVVGRRRVLGQGIEGHRGRPAGARQKTLRRS